MFTWLKRIFHQHSWVTVKRVEDVHLCIRDGDGQLLGERDAVLVCQQCTNCLSETPARRAILVAGGFRREVKSVPSHIREELGW